MNKPEFFVTPGYGEFLLNELHYSQAVKLAIEWKHQGKAAGMIIYKFSNRSRTRLLRRFRT
jgi:hypothetical protein